MALYTSSFKAIRTSTQTHKVHFMSIVQQSRYGRIKEHAFIIRMCNSDECPHDTTIPISYAFSHVSSLLLLFLLLFVVVSCLLLFLLLVVVSCLLSLSFSSVSCLLLLFFLSPPSFPSVFFLLLSVFFRPSSRCLLLTNKTFTGRYTKQHYFI